MALLSVTSSDKATVFAKLSSANSNETTVFANLSSARKSLEEATVFANQSSVTESSDETTVFANLSSARKSLEEATVFANQSSVTESSDETTVFANLSSARKSLEEAVEVTSVPTLRPTHLCRIRVLIFYLDYCHYAGRNKTKLYVPPILYVTLRCIIETFRFKRLPANVKVFRNNHNTQIYIRGLDGKTFALNVKLGDDVKDLRAMIREEKGIRVKEQRLAFGGKQLMDGKKLFEYNIQKESTLDLSLRLRGGNVCDKVCMLSC